MMLVPSLRAWFAGLLEDVAVVHDVKPYIVQTLCKDEFVDLERSSIVLARAAAVSFVDRRNIGDYAFWKSSFAQGYTHQVVVESLGRLSYYDCYKMSNRKMLVYEVMADELPELTKAIHVRMATPLTSTHMSYT